MSHIAVFIDWANVFSRVNMDVVKLREFLESLGNIHVVYAYMVDFRELHRRDDPTGAKRSPTGFWSKLGKQGFRLHLKPVKVIWEGGKEIHKANCDIEMAIDILKTAQGGRMDEVILFSGDSDFEPLVREIQSPPHLIKVTVVASGKHTASELRRCADWFIDLDEHLHKFSRPYEERPRQEVVVVEEEAELPPVSTTQQVVLADLVSELAPLTDEDIPF